MGSLFLKQFEEELINDRFPPTKVPWITHFVQKFYEGIIIEMLNLSKLRTNYVIDYKESLKNFMQAFISVFIMVYLKNVNPLLALR